MFGSKQLSYSGVPATDNSGRRRSWIPRSAGRDSAVYPSPGNLEIWRSGDSDVWFAHDKISLFQRRPGLATGTCGRNRVCRNVLPSQKKKESSSPIIIEEESLCLYRSAFMLMERDARLP